MQLLTAMLTKTMNEIMARRFRVLGEPMRLRILQALEKGEKPVNDIAALLATSQPNISRHLKALCQEGLLGRRREGLNVFYGISDSMVFELCELVCRSAEQHTLSQLEQLRNSFPQKRRGNARDRR